MKSHRLRLAQKSYPKGFIHNIAEHAPSAASIPSFLGDPLMEMPLKDLLSMPLKALHGAYDVVVNGEDYNTRMRDRVFDPKKSMAEVCTP
jgi:hypothetical protein